MVRAGLLVLVALGLQVAGCATVTETWDSWFGEEPTPMPTPATDRADLYYAATDGVVMYTLPSATSDIVARLTLHQPVTRISLTRGFANVTTEAGLVGWVDTTQLLWRLPATPTPVPATEPPADGGAPVATDTPAF